MNSTTAPQPGPLTRLLQRVSDIEPEETGAVITAFLLFFCVLGGYFMVRPVRETVAAIDPNLPVADGRPMGEFLRRSKATSRFNTMVLGTLGAIALVLAGGVLSVVSIRGTASSLVRARDAYYAAGHFADVFATLTRAPDEVRARLAAPPSRL